jgi:hypothetical protein
MKNKILLLTLIFTLAFSTFSFAIESEVEKVQSTISQLEVLRTEENRVSKSLISEMASGLLELESAVRMSGKTATAEVYSILDRAEGVLKGVPDSYAEVQSAKKAIETVRTSLGVSAYFEEKNAEAVSLSDIKGHWGEANIKALVARGGIAGYPDGTFRPNNTITRAEFVTIAVKSPLNGQISGQVGSHWASGAFQTARDKNVLLLNDFPESEWNKPITRYEMAYVMIRVTENIMKEQSVSTTDVAKIMSDYQEVSKQQKYKYYVEQAFMKGLVGGKTTDGLYDGKANGTRAEAATMIVRMLDKTKRGVVDTNKVITSDRVISLTDGSRPLVPKPGDTVIKADGTKVVLKVGPAGVLGEGQGVDYYSGITFANGNVFKDGSLGVPSMGTANQTYLVDPRTGEGHFALEWVAIRSYYADAAFKEHGHTAKVGTVYKNFVMYDGSKWTWLGPVNQ